MTSRRQPLHSVKNNIKLNSSNNNNDNLNNGKTALSVQMLGLNRSAARKSIGVVSKDENYFAIKKTPVLPATSSISRNSTSISRQSLLNMISNGKTHSRNSLQGRDSISRRLSMFSSGDVKYIQDPRPLKDRVFIQTAIQQLIQFLTFYNYDKIINNSMLTSPSKKDFFCILEFLFRFIDESFQWTRKEEDETPAVFKLLRYPFQLSSRSLSSVGTPHAWPTFLGALHWLVNLLEYNEKASEFLQAEMREDTSWSSEVLRESFFMFTAEAYCAFMSNNDVMEQELEVKFSQNLLSRNELIKKTLNSKEDDTRSIRGQIEVLVNSETRTSSIERQVQIHEKDVSKYQKVISALEGQIAEYTTQIEMSESILMEEQQAVELLTSEVHELEQRLFSQLEQNLDVDRLNQEHRELEQAINITISHRNNIENHTWDIEMAISEQFNLVEEKLAIFNQHLRENDMLSRFGGEMRFNPLSTPMFSINLAKLKPELKNFLEEIILEYTKYQQTLFRVSSEAEKLAETVSSSKHILQDFQSQLHNESSTLERLKKASEDDKNVIEEEILIVRNKIEQLIFDHRGTIRSKEAQKNQIVKSIENSRIQSQQTTAQLSNQTKALESILKKHKKCIEEILTRTISEFECRLAG